MKCANCDVEIDLKNHDATWDPYHQVMLCGDSLCRLDIGQKMWGKELGGCFVCGGKLPNFHEDWCADFMRAWWESMSREVTMKTKEWRG